MNRKKGATKKDSSRDNSTEIELSKDENITVKRDRDV